MKDIRPIFLASALGLAGPQAEAGPVDTLGFGARAMGRGAGGVALADGAGDVFRNPALLQELEDAQALLGISLHRSAFTPIPAVWWDTNRDGRIDDTDPGLEIGVDPDPADAMQFALGQAVGPRLGLGLAAHMPTKRILRITTFDPSLPNYFMLGDRQQRFELAAGFGWEALDGLSLGGALELLAQTRFHVLGTLTTSASLGGDTLEDLGDLLGEVEVDIHEMRMDLVPSVAPVLSLHWDAGASIAALEGLQGGLVFRGSAGMPVDVILDMQANVAVEGMGDLEPFILTALIPAHMAFLEHYIPPQLTGGLAWTGWDGIRLYADLRRTHWVDWEMNIAHLVEGEIDSQLLDLEDGEITDGNILELSLENTVGIRAGGEVALAPIDVGGRIESLHLTLRGGFNLEPSPLVSQGVGSALLDADRLGFSVGASLAHADPFAIVSGPISWDAFGAWQVLATGALPATDAPHSPGQPVDGSGVPVGGSLWSMGLQASIDH
jgi:hypothetical protein